MSQSSTAVPFLKRAVFQMTSYPVPGVGAFEFAAFYEANVQKVVGGAEYIL